MGTMQQAEHVKQMPATKSKTPPFQVASQKRQSQSKKNEKGFPKKAGPFQKKQKQKEQKDLAVITPPKKPKKNYEEK